MEFKDQYRHPLWQKRRLEVLERAEFACECCGETESQLHVHHRQYFKGRKIWEYAENELEALCDSCHEEAHHRLDSVKVLLSTLPVDAIDEIAALVAGYRAEVRSPAGTENAYNEFFRANPCAFKRGQLAATSAGLPVYVLDELISEVERNQYGGRIELSIPARSNRGFE